VEEALRQFVSVVSVLLSVNLLHNELVGCSCQNGKRRLGVSHLCSLPFPNALLL
jgi:hypothetical protein